MSKYLDAQTSTFSDVTLKNKESYFLLSKREIEVLIRLRLGLSLTAIAKNLGLSIKTVSTHKRNAMRKIGLSKDIDLYKWLLLS